MRKNKVLLIIIAILALVTLLENAKATSICESYYADTGSIFARRAKWFEHEPERIGDSQEPRYSPVGRVVELKQAPMTNQCRTSECYLFSVVNYINVANANKPGHESVVISDPFLVAHKFLEHIKEGVWYGAGSDRVIHDLKGGFPFEAFHLSRKVGLVPKESWQPKTPYEEWDTKAMYSALEQKIPEWHNYIRSLAQHHNSWDALPVRAAEREAYENLKNIVLINTGPLPNQFEYQKQVFTAKDFEKKFGAPRNVRFVIDNKEGHGMPNNIKVILDEAFSNHQGAWKYQTGNYQTIMQEAVNFIEAGYPVIMDFNWKNDGHSMLLVGFEINAQNKISRFKVMNSWGTNYANEGYVWYTPEDIWEHVRRSYKFGKM